MRFFVLAGLTFLGACSVEVDRSGSSEGAAGGYTLEVRADEQEQVFLVRAPDGKVAAGRVAGGVSALLDADAIQAFADTPAPDRSGEPEVVSIRAPGFELSVRGDPEGTGEDGGQVSIDVGETSIDVNAQDGATDAEDRANVRIAGVDEAAARDFIAKADELSPEVQAQMLAALGLE